MIGFVADMNMNQQGSKAVYGYRILRDVGITMRDGVRLSANIFLPGAEGKFPVIFQRMPYGHSGNGIGEFYAQRGYAYLIQDCRGRYDSAGEFYPFRDDGRDGYDSLDWICAQPWSNGRVGMFGPSYLGAVQWLLAIEKHPALQAIVPNVIPGDFWRNGYWKSGTFSLALNSLWLCLEISGRTSDLNMIPAYDLNAFFRHLPLMTLDEKAGRPCQFWKDFLKNNRYGKYWESLGIHHRYEQIQVPTFIMGGWFDYYPGEAFRSFNGLRKNSRDEKLKKRRKIIIGPWQHLISNSTKLGEIDFGAESLLDINNLALRWFDCLLKDINTGILDEPPVAIFVMGINKWRQENEWPLARTRYVDYYLHSGGAAGTDGHDGVLSIEPPGEEIPDEYIYDPENPVPTIGGNHSICWPAAYHVIAPGPFDQRKVEIRNDVLVYTSDPLAEDLEVTGLIQLALYAASDAQDTDWTAKLVDVYPDGRAMNLSEGVIRAKFRESIYAEPKLLEPGRIYEYEIEMQPTSNVFLKGHRIRLDISSSNFPLWDRNLNTGHETGMDAEMRIARQTIYHSRKYPSRLRLPVIP